MCSNEEFSVITSRALDTLGYSPRMVNRRQKAYDIYSTVLTIYHRTLSGDPLDSVTISGSKREGITGPLQSDTDMMMIWGNVIATRDITTVRPSTQIIFKLDDEDTPAGYTKLKLSYIKERNDPLFELIERGLFHETPRSLYLSSRYFMSSLEENDSTENKSWMTVDKQTRHGPSLPRVVTLSQNGLSYAYDHVTAFPCKCTKLLQSWVNRPRRFKWPSEALIKEIAFSESHVVPVGVKITEDDFSQWRICCTRAEIILMKSLNETQWKLYVLLKMLKSSFLESISDGITSYLLKNILMWVIENNPVERFHLYNLLKMFLHCIAFLKQCVYEKVVPSYLIPSRNLLLGKLSAHQHKRLLYELDEILNSGVGVISMLPDLQKAIIDIVVQPDVATFNMESRDNAEELSLMEFFIPIPQQVDRLIQLFDSTSDDAFIKYQLPLTRLKSYQTRFARLCRDVNLNSESGFKATVEDIRRKVNIPRYLDHIMQNVQQTDLETIIDISQIFGNKFNDQFSDFIKRNQDELAMDEVAMDILNNMPIPHNMQSLVDLCSAIFQICPSTTNKISKILDEMPMFRQMVVSIIKKRPRLSHSMDQIQMERAVRQRPWLTTQCVSGFKGPNSAYARILSRK